MTVVNPGTWPLSLRARDRVPGNPSLRPPKAPVAGEPLLPRTSKDQTMGPLASESGKCRLRQDADKGGGVYASSPTRSMVGKAIEGCAASNADGRHERRPDQVPL